MIVTFRSTIRKSVRCVLLVAAGATLATGCGDERPVPGTPPSYSSTPSAQDAAAADKAAVEKAYRGYLDAIEEMSASGDVDVATLRPWATADTAQQDVETLSLLFDQGLRQVGDIGVDVRSIKVTGEEATLLACLDTTHVVTVKKGREPAPGATGLPPGLARATLVRQDGTWLFDDSEEAGRC
jgi:hypothetical protein